MAVPDWIGFGRAIIGEWPGLYDIDAAEVFELSLKHGVIQEVPGGFDPDKHDDFFGVGLERGDPFYRYAPECPSCPPENSGPKVL